VDIPGGVEVSFAGGVFKAKSSKGELSCAVHRNMKLEINEKTIVVLRPNDIKFNRSLHGLTRSLIFNAIEGVTKGFTKTLEINGIGYRAQKQGKDLIMSLGFSHKVIVPEIEGITVEVPASNRIVIHGIDKQKVGQFAADVRIKRPPEPYKGRGIKYNYEIIRRKEGKAGKSAKK
jgi:large subunit ribosomal protein L6